MAEAETLRHSGRMTLVYVTGSAGSGKSAVAIELRRLGVDAYDEDDPEIGSAHNRLSGRPVPVPPADERSPQWFSEHEWRLRDGVLDQLRNRAIDALVVLCGNVFPPVSAIETFDRVLHLDVDEETLRQRITARVDNDYGQTSEEMHRILDRHRELAAACRVCGVVTVDATQPLTGVAGDIVQATAPA